MTEDCQSRRQYSVLCFPSQQKPANVRFRFRDVIISDEPVFIVIDQPGLFVSFQGVKQRVFTELGGELRKSAYTHFCQQADAAREIRAFPTAGETFFITAAAVFAPVPAGAAVGPAAGTRLVVAADAAGQTAIGQSLFSSHYGDLSGDAYGRLLPYVFRDSSFAAQ